jgi:hypothetical protein
MTAVWRTISPTTKKVSIGRPNKKQVQGTIMKNKLPIIAILAISSQLALAEAANDPDIQGAAAANETVPVAGAATADTEEAVQTDTSVSTSKLPPLTIEVGASLQFKLDAQMEFQLGPQPNHEQEIASVH